jgi:hypothetical protein
MLRLHNVVSVAPQLAQAVEPNFLDSYQTNMADTHTRINTHLTLQRGTYGMASMGKDAGCKHWKMRFRN